MKHFLFLAFVAFFGAACVHEETRPVEISGTITGLHVDLRDFLKFSKADLERLTRALETPDARPVKLSEGRLAKCHAKACRVRSDSFDGELKAADLAKFNSTLSRARVSRNEEQLKDGPVTIRCLPDRCSADFYLNETKPQKFATTGTLKTTEDHTGFVLGSFIGGVIGAAGARGFR